MKKKGVVIVTCIFLGLGLLFVLCIPKKTQNVDKSTIFQCFKDNRDTFVFIRDYAAKSEGYLNVPSQGGMVNWTEEGAMPITEEDVLSHIEYLQTTLSFHAIYEGQPDIYFVGYDDRYYTRGIAYIPDGDMPLSFLESELLSDNWYYYESGKV